MLYFLRGSVRKTIIPILFIIIIIGASYFYLVHFEPMGSYQARIENIPTEVSGRLSLIRGGFEVFKNNIFFGGGYGNSSILHQEYSGKSSEYYSVHNNYVAVLSDNGLAGFIPFIFSILIPLAIALISYKKEWAKDNMAFFNTFSSMTIGLLFLSWGGTFFQLTVISSFFWTIASVIMRGEDVMVDKEKIEDSN